MVILLWPWYPAQAAPAGQSVSYYRFYLTVHSEAATEGAPICVGDKVTFRVRAWRTVKYVSQPNEITNMAYGVPVSVTSNDVLKLIGKNSQRVTNPLTFDEETGESGFLEFTFKAMKPGQVRLFFEAMFPKTMVDSSTLKQLSASDQRNLLYDSVDKTVSVVECPLKLNVLSQYNTPPAMGMFWQFIGVIKDAPLQQSGEDEDKFFYEGVEKIVITSKAPLVRFHGKRAIDL